ncbi:MAG: single-stranded DNA-binding protein [Carnobacterium sp.]|nr:single-stranded DNA-binding protein [Carnobacterium sp.]
MINNVVLVGRLTKDIDLRYTTNGTADFINCVAWKKTAEIIANYSKKGSQIGIEGSIQTRSYDNNEGKRVYITEVLVQSVTLLDSKSESGNESNEHT